MMEKRRRDSLISMCRLLTFLPLLSFKPTFVYSLNFRFTRNVLVVLCWQPSPDIIQKNTWVLKLLLFYLEILSCLSHSRIKKYVTHVTPYLKTMWPHCHMYILVWDHVYVVEANMWIWNGWADWTFCAPLERCIWFAIRLFWPQTWKEHPHHQTRVSCFKKDGWLDLV